jgi:mannosyltransferase
MLGVRLRSATGRPEFWIVATLTVVAAVLRFAILTDQSYWLDEATTVHELGLSFGGLLHVVHHDETTPPLYFVLAWVWARIFGTGEIGLRSFSAILGIATVPLAYAAGREIVDRATGMVTALLVCVSPLMLWYSQEARSYALLTALLAASLWLWARARRTGGTRDLIGWAIASALAVGTHFFAGFLVAPEGIWLLWTLRSRAALGACVLVAAVQLALLPSAIGDTNHLLDWLGGLSLGTRLNQVPVLLAASELYRSPSSLVSDGLIFALVAALGAVALLGVGGGAVHRRGAAVAGALGLIAVLLPIILALCGSDYVVPRNLIGVFVPFAIVIGAAVTAPRTRPLGAAVLVLILAGFVAADISTQTGQTYMRPNWRGVAQALGPARTPRAVVIGSGDVGEEPLTVYLAGTRDQFSYGGTIPGGPPRTVGEVDVVGQAYQTVARPLPAGVSLISDQTVDGILVARFLLGSHETRTPQQIVTMGEALLTQHQDSAPAVLFQKPPE